MITRTEIYGIAAVFLGVLVFFAYTISIRRDAVAAEQQKQILAIVQEKLDAIQKDRQTVTTPSQVAAMVPRYTPEIKPIVIVPGGVPTNVSDVGGNIPSISLPDAPSAISAGSLVIPSEQVPAYKESVLKCAETGVKLDGCQKELEAEKKKHGGFWRAVGECGLKIGAPAAVGGAFGGQKGAIGGAAVGLGTCFIKF